MIFFGMGNILNLTMIFITASNINYYDQRIQRYSSMIFNVNFQIVYYLSTFLIYIAVVHGEYYPASFAVIFLIFNVFCIFSLYY